MAKRRMSKMMGKGAGKSLTVGNKKDGARPSKKHQVSALLPQNKIGGKSPRMKRMEKMEKTDMPV